MQEKVTIKIDLDNNASHFTCIVPFEGRVRAGDTQPTGRMWPAKGVVTARDF